MVGSGGGDGSWLVGWGVLLRLRGLELVVVVLLFVYVLLLVIV